MRMKPMINSDKDLFSSSRVRELQGRGQSFRSHSFAQTCPHTCIKALLDRVVHGLADVQHGVENDGVLRQLRLVPAPDKHERTDHGLSQRR